MQQPNYSSTTEIQIPVEYNDNLYTCLSYYKQLEEEKQPVTLALKMCQNSNQILQNFQVIKRCSWRTSVTGSGDSSMV